MNNMMYEDQPQHHGVKPNYSDNITAAKMRELAEKNVSLELGIEIQKWLDRIQTAANGNKFSVQAPEAISDACKKRLESRGFKVIVSGTYDHRDREKWESATVSW